MSENIIPEQKPYKKIGAFKFFCIQNFPFIADDFDQMTYYELLCKLAEYMKKLVENNNVLIYNQEELLKAFNQLQEYINNYFDNLDVQDEINNKLDDMVESGELQEIVENIFTSLQTQIDSIEDDTIGDLTKLNTLDKSSVVNSIINTDTNQYLNLGRSIVYDIPGSDDIGHVQASCVNGDLMYVTVQGGTSFPNGDILVFNIATNTYVGKYENLPFYHANDIVYLNGKLYIIELDSHNIGVYDITNGTYTTITTFANYPIKPIGIDKVGDKLLVWCGDIVVEPNHIGDYTFNNDLFHLFNPISLEVEKTYTINNPYKILDFYPYNVTNVAIVRQCFTVFENTLYCLFQQPNVIVKCNIETNTIKPLKFYNIPDYDKDGNPRGETEGISLIDNQYYPKGSFMLGCRTLNNMRNGTIYGHDIVSNFIFNPYVNATNYNDMAYGDFQRSYSNYEALSVSKTATGNSLIEVGSSAYPFKDLNRAINRACNTKNKVRIYLRDSETYYLPYLYDVNVQICLANNSINPVIYIGDIENSNISFWTDRTNATITIRPINDNKRISIINSNVNVLSQSTNDMIIFNNCQLLLTTSTLKTRRCKFLNTETVSSGYAIQVNDGSIFTDGFATVTLAGTDKFVMTGGAGVAWVQPAESHTYYKQSYSSMNLYN